MNAHNEQNGRHASFPSDPRIRNLPPSEQNKFCKDYIWGVCYKHGQCRFRHECTLEEMKSVIKFCHDYQNGQPCSRPVCTYLHTSSEEQKLFLTSGKWPRALLERHAAMTAAAAAAAAPLGAGNIAPMENASPLYVAQPPPPPPPPIGAMAPPPPPLPQPVPTAMPPPPPPPPTEPSTLHSVAPAPIYTAPPPGFQLNQPPPTLPRFDTSRPPPPIQAGIRNGTLKRSIADACEAGPSKQRKHDDGKVAENLCEMCIQRELSIKMCTEELEKLIRERDYKKILYKTKIEETKNMKALMRYLLPAEICLAVEDYITGANSETSSLGLSVPMQLMMSRLMVKVTNSNSVIDSMQSSSMRELFVRYLLNSGTSEPSSKILTADVIRSTTSSITSNNFSRLVSGQRPSGPPPSSVPATPVVPAVPPTATPASARPINANTPSAPRAYPSVGAPAPPPYPPPYQPAVPPPAMRPAYSAIAPPPPAPQGTPPSPYYPSAPRTPALTQPPAGPSTSTPTLPAPSNGHNYGPYMMGGYNSPHYYPPYQ